MFFPLWNSSKISSSSIINFRVLVQLELYGNIFKIRFLEGHDQKIFFKNDLKNI